MPKVSGQDQQILEQLVKVLHLGLISPNVADSNYESANIVDVVQFLANAVAKVAYRIGSDPDESPDRNGVVGAGTVAYAINRVADAIFAQVETQDGLHRVADAINNLATAVREKV